MLTNTSDFVQVEKAEGNDNQIAWQQPLHTVSVSLEEVLLSLLCHSGSEQFPIVATVYDSKAVVWFGQLVLAHLGKPSWRCNAKLLPLVSEQHLAVPGGIHCNCTHDLLVPPLLRHCPAVSSASVPCAFQRRRWGTAAVISALLWCPAALQSRVEIKPG